MEENEIFIKEYEIFQGLWGNHLMTCIKIATLAVTAVGGAFILAAEKNQFSGIAVCFLIDFLILWMVIHQGEARHIALYLIELEHKINQTSSLQQDGMGFYHRYAASEAAREIPAHIETRIGVIVFAATVYVIGYIHAIIKMPSWPLPLNPVLGLLLLLIVVAFGLFNGYLLYRLQVISMKNKKDLLKRLKNQPTK